MNCPPTAILTANDVIAVACLTTVQRSEQRVSDDVAIIRIGDEIFSRYTTPILTTCGAKVPPLQSQRPRQDAGQPRCCWLKSTMSRSLKPGSSSQLC